MSMLVYILIFICVKAAWGTGPTIMPTSTCCHVQPVLYEIVLETFYSHEKNIYGIYARSLDRTILYDILEYFVQ